VDHVKFSFYQVLSGVHVPKNLINLKLYMNSTKNLIEDKLYMNPTKNLIEDKLHMSLSSIRFLVEFI
jgi:hypothetical protein